MGGVLLPVILLLVLLSAIAAGSAAYVRTEVLIADRFRSSSQALYAAEAALDLAVAELRALPLWTAVSGGSVASRHSRGSFTATHRLPGGGSVELCCGRGTMFARLAASSSLSPMTWRRTLTWRPYLWAPFDSLVRPDRPTGLMIVVFVADLAGTDGITSAEKLLLRAEGMDTGGGRRVIEAVVHRDRAGGGEGSDRGGGGGRVTRILTWHEVR